MFGFSKWRLRREERLIWANTALAKEPNKLIGITRVRNEALILQDTLDYVGTKVDSIIAYDDASTDDTLAILKSHPKVALIISNTAWIPNIEGRLLAETRHRGLLINIARKYLKFDWIYCFDADERVIGDLLGFLNTPSASACDGVRIRLFDAYMTPQDQSPFQTGDGLLGFRRYFGPERRDILMLWRDSPRVIYKGLDAREPTGINNSITEFYCQHYGKSISIDQWEKTCDYYSQHFPSETYGSKWLKRKGCAVHTESDFGRPLFEWGPTLFNNAVVIN